MTTRPKFTTLSLCFISCVFSLLINRVAIALFGGVFPPTRQTRTLGQTVNSNKWNAIPHLSCLMLFHLHCILPSVQTGSSKSGEAIAVSEEPLNAQTHQGVKTEHHFRPYRKELQRAIAPLLDYKLSANLAP
ncbi:hypothetical protein [Oscillatoria sp. HE19RPO]|uniref:hypothetical protein n=1 Tax=Oscillatoria sp. HE19RPO TaxID=2954806 RepID=UPI0020C3B8C3|nr:hypothetical protein [Oscillatoria sp. HE19RPO]